MTVAGAANLGSLTAGTSSVGDLNINGSATVTGNASLNGHTSVGVVGVGNLLALNDHPIYLRGEGDSYHALVHSSNFAGVSMDGPALYGSQGGVLGSTQNGPRVALQWDSGNNVNITNALTVRSTGGNVAHACVVRTQTGSYNTPCQGGEVAVGGGGRCSNGWRIIESMPWIGTSESGVPSDGATPTAWRAVCQV